MYSSNPYKASHDHFKTLHEILRVTVDACGSLFVWFSFVLVMILTKENQDSQNEFGIIGSSLW